jgi:hypothetical protein
MNRSVRSHTVLAAIAPAVSPLHSNVPVDGLIAAGVEHINHANAGRIRRR